MAAEKITLIFFLNVFMGIADEDVIFVTWDEACHAIDSF